MRTNNLADPKSWRAWDGSSFSIRFINPYTETPAQPSAHMCKNVGGGYITGMTESLTYNTYFGKYMLVGAFGGVTPGFYYSLSDDLINWVPARLMLQRETAQSHVCGDPDPVRDPSLLDPTSGSRNFDTTGRDPYIYYKFMRMNSRQPGCYASADRDLIRIPLRFTGTVPSAQFSASPTTALVDQQVTFNGSSSTDPGGNPITYYEWDLDGDGTFESTTVGNPAKTQTFTRPQSGRVGMRVTDSEGYQDVIYRRFNVNAKMHYQRSNLPVASTYARETGAAWTDARGYGWVRQDSLANPTHTPLDLTPTSATATPVTPTPTRSSRTRSCSCSPPTRTRRRYREPGRWPCPAAPTWSR